MVLIFKNRKEAGVLLAKELQQYNGKKDAVVLAIPRGGLEIGNAFAKELKLPLDVIIVKKLSNVTFFFFGICIDASSILSIIYFVEYT